MVHAAAGIGRAPSRRHSRKNIRQASVPSSVGARCEVKRQVICQYVGNAWEILRCR